MDDNVSWLSFKDQLQAHYEALETYHRELGGEYDDASSTLMSVLQAALQASLEATKAECDRVREDCESMLRDMAMMRTAMGEISRSTGPNDPFAPIVTRSVVKTPLLDTQKVLRIEHSATRRAFDERAVKVTELYDRLRSFADILPPEIVGLDIPVIDENHPPEDVSLSKLGQLDSATARCVQELSKRKKQVQIYGREIVQLWAELAIETHTIDSQEDRAILLDAQKTPEALGLSDEALTKLELKRDNLQQEKQRRSEIIEALMTSIRSLHRKLRLPEADLTTFSFRVRGVAQPVVSICEGELARLIELKKDHIEDFVMDARLTLDELWDMLYYNEDERLEFTPAFSDVYTDASLQAHENEITRLQSKVQELEPLLSLVAKHMDLDQERKNLEIQVSDPARFSKRGYNPMAESKLRARIENTMPRVESALRDALAKYEVDYLVPFRVWGELYLGDQAPVRKPISRLESALNRSTSSDRPRTAETVSKVKPRTPGPQVRPTTTSTTPATTGHPLSRSISTPVRSQQHQSTSQAPSRSPTKRSVSHQQPNTTSRPVTGVLRERTDSNATRLPTKSKLAVVSGVRSSTRKNTSPELPSTASRAAGTTTSTDRGGTMPPKMRQAHMAITTTATATRREVSGSSTSSQVSTENWDAYEHSSEEDEAGHRHATLKTSMLYDRAKAAEMLVADQFESTSARQSRVGQVEGAGLREVPEETSFVDDWGEEGF